MDTPIAEIKDRLRIALEAKGKTAAEVVKATGISKGSMSQYMSGFVKPKQDRIFLIAQYLGVNEAWLMGYDVPMSGNPKHYAKHDLVSVIPVYSAISCGRGTWIEDEPEDFIGIPQSMIGSSEYFGNRAVGDSMEQKIHNGDYVIFEKTPVIESGQIGAFSLNNEFFCKRFRKTATGLFILESENPIYDPILVNPDDQFRVLGKYKMRLTRE